MKDVIKFHAEWCAPCRYYKTVWNEAKEKIKRSNHIRGLSEEIYNQTRKAPYHFESIKEFNAYDVMCRNRATKEAIRRLVAKDMAVSDE